jgi:hypothetical protein
MTVASDLQIVFFTVCCWYVPFFCIFIRYTNKCLFFYCVFPLDLWMRLGYYIFVQNYVL